VVCDPAKCLPCKICEVACSAVKDRSIDPLFSRIRVVNFEPVGSMAIACVLCEDAPCVGSCPRDALRQDEKTGVIIVDEVRCNGCGWCFEACPFGAIALHPTKRKVTICDLCDGEPKCVEYCPFGALTFGTWDDVGHEMRKESVRRLVTELAEG
jgi:carbon-monoxide dehydrogenase iron sulfur subunit